MQQLQAALERSESEGAAATHEMQSRLTRISEENLETRDTLEKLAVDLRREASLDREASSSSQAEAVLDKALITEELQALKTLRSDFNSWMESIMTQHEQLLQNVEQAQTSRETLDKENRGLSGHHRETESTLELEERLGSVERILSSLSSAHGSESSFGAVQGKAYIPKGASPEKLYGASHAGGSSKVGVD